eukprot:3423770-Pleurochrysis_carterae.AAC.3
MRFDKRVPIDLQNHDGEISIHHLLNCARWRRAVLSLLISRGFGVCFCSAKTNYHTLALVVCHVALSERRWEIGATITLISGCSSLTDEFRSSSDRQIGGCVFCVVKSVFEQLGAFRMTSSGVLIAYFGCCGRHTSTHLVIYDSAHFASGPGLA